MFRIHHATRFTYEKPAHQSHNETRLALRTNPRQRCIKFRLTANDGASIVTFRDWFGNIVYSVSMHSPHEEFQIVAESIVERDPPRSARGERLTFDRYLADDELRTGEFYEFPFPHGLCAV